MMTVTFAGKEYTLTDGAYYQADRGMYRAHATDKDGNEYMVYWKILRPNADDRADVCDWDTPAAVEGLYRKVRF